MQITRIFFRMTGDVFPDTPPAPRLRVQLDSNRSVKDVRFDPEGGI
jgi:hypothetical protein